MACMPAVFFHLYAAARVVHRMAVEHLGLEAASAPEVHKVHVAMRAGYAVLVRPGGFATCCGQKRTLSADIKLTLHAPEVHNVHVAMRAGYAVLVGPCGFGTCCGQEDAQSAAWVG